MNKIILTLASALEALWVHIDEIVLRIAQAWPSLEVLTSNILNPRRTKNIVLPYFDCRYFQSRGGATGGQLKRRLKSAAGGARKVRRVALEKCLTFRAKGTGFSGLRQAVDSASR